MKACWSSLMSNPRKSGYAGSMASLRTISFVDSSSRDTPFRIWTENIDHVVRFTSKNETSSPQKRNKFASNCKTGDIKWRRDGVFTQSKKITCAHIVNVNITRACFPVSSFWHKMYLLIIRLCFVGVYAEYIVRLCYRTGSWRASTTGKTST